MACSHGLCPIPERASHELGEILVWGQYQVIAPSKYSVKISRGNLSSVLLRFPSCWITLSLSPLESIRFFFIALATQKSKGLKSISRCTNMYIKKY